LVGGKIEWGWWRGRGRGGRIGGGTEPVIAARL